MTKSGKVGSSPVAHARVTDNVMLFCTGYGSHSVGHRPRGFLHCTELRFVFSKYLRLARSNAHFCGFSVGPSSLGLEEIDLSNKPKVVVVVHYGVCRTTCLKSPHGASKRASCLSKMQHNQWALGTESIQTKALGRFSALATFSMKPKTSPLVKGVCGQSGIAGDVRV